MGLVASLGLFAFGVGLMALTVWLEKRPRNHLRPTLLPTRPFLFLGTIITILAAVHLLTFLH